jgi:hypothetical protein
MSTAPVTTPATPEVTINNSAAEILAAIEAQTPPDSGAAPAAAVAPTPATPPVAPAAAAPEPLPFTVNETADGVEIKLETGAVYKGKTWAEAASALAKGKVEADKTLHSLRSQPKQPEAPATPAPVVEDPDAATREWLMGQLAKEFGLEPSQFKQAVGQMFEVTQKTNINVAWTDFASQCPDFVDSKENAEALIAYLPPEVVTQQRPFNAEDLRRAHALALYEKKYAPATTSTSTPAVPVPPAMPTAGAGQQQTGYTEKQLMNMSADELKKLAFQQ